MQFKHVTLDFDGSVAVLKLDHQEVMNAISIDMLGGLGEALDAIEDRRAEVRCLVITGAGRFRETAQHVHGDRVHHLLVVELEDRDRTIEIERDVFELHGFLMSCGLCQFRRPELLLPGRIFDFWRGLVHGDRSIASNLARSG